MDLDGVLLDTPTERQLVEAVVADARAGRGGWVVTVNVDILRRLRRDPASRLLVGRATVVVADGMPLVWAARLQRTPVPERVAGSSLVWSLSAAAEGRLSVYLLGGPPGVAGLAAAALVGQYPRLRVAGADSPPMGFEDDPAEVTRSLRAVIAAAPEIVFCGFGFPKQEWVIARLRPALPDAWFVGCGAALDFAAGVVPRAPRWMQASGLEWLHRLAGEPRRLFRRYVLDDMPYAGALIARSAAAGVPRALSLRHCRPERLDE